MEAAERRSSRLLHTHTCCIGSSSSGNRVVVEMMFKYSVYTFIIPMRRAGSVEMRYAMRVLKMNTIQYNIIE